MIVTLEVDVDVRYADLAHGEPGATTARGVAVAVTKEAFAAHAFACYRSTRPHPVYVSLAGVRVKKETPEA